MTRPSMEHLANFFSKKLLFWKNKFEITTRPTFHGTLGKKIFRKNYPKTCSKHVWTIWEQIWAFLKLRNFLNFLKNLSKTRPSMEHWAEKIFRKNYPNTFSKHVWTLLGTILGIFGILKISSFLENISKTRPSMEHRAKKTFRKVPQNMFKIRLDNLGTILGVFGILKTFWKHFDDSSLHGTMGTKIFRKNYPKTCSKHVWTIWEQFWAFLEFWKLFKNISMTRASMEHWAKKCFEKIAPKHVQNTFGQFGNDFGRLLNFEKF